MRGFKPHTVRDQLRFLSNPARLRGPAFNVIARVQDHTPGEQILGTAVALIAMCESANISLQDVIEHARNAMSHAEGPYSAHVQAVRDYSASEIARGEEARLLPGAVL